ncbi:DUF2935 domain-containing protein [Salinibacillus xinjiangensis]|uniref:DUF2935 domain-containing protein n=1 Tax=Salinibacillus xinjiangensis TaxID=1229268 RepID=A0A6G1X8N3_9BACI|nr:DUF2935 domain-containing protein [Salinibacillus xinjiangensis]MRG87302.1 DUF2935 domain-containing protein [Salinibacillus xinjiangensis]
MKSFADSAAFEHSFWLQVLGDHARFIRDSLYPSEKSDIDKAKTFVQQFDQLLNQARNSTAESFVPLSDEAKKVAKAFRTFKLSILERQLQGQVKIHLSPTFINHMVNELDEYLKVLKYLTKGEPVPVFHELHHHLLWLQDAYGHAGAINDELDGVEKRLKQKSNDFTKHFEGFYLKAVELTGYLRSNLTSFPALDRFNHDVELEMSLFKAFLEEVEELELSERVLSSFSALMADHMAREECYYLIKLAESSQTQPPHCDPGKPRTTD